MELQLLSFPPLLFTFFLLLPLLLVIKSGNKPKRQNLPPGPWKLPIIGNLHHLLGAPPHRALRDLSRKHGPIMHLKLGHVDHIIISSPEDATEIMKTHDRNFASRPNIIAISILLYGSRGTSFAPYSSYWRQMRKIVVLELLSARRVNSFCSIRKEVVRNLISDVRHSNPSPVNLSEKLLRLANTTVTRAAFGMECKHAQRFLSAVKVAMEFTSGFDVADMFPNLRFVDALTGVSSTMRRIHRQIDEIMEEIIKDHQTKRETKQEEEDLVDVLLGLIEKGDFEFPLTIINVKAVILEMFIAGTETTSMTLEWAMAELMRHPEAMKKVQAEVRQALGGKAEIEEGDMGKLEYMRLVIKETLRLHPPLPLLLPRVCGEACQVGGYEIPAGSRVLVNGWAIGRDPRYWEDAESYRPERFVGSSVDFKGGSFEYLPFGGGRRVCPGMTFGMAGVELALSQMLYHFDWGLPGGMKPEEVDMTESVGVTVGRKSALCLIATPHVQVPAGLSEDHK